MSDQGLKVLPFRECTDEVLTEVALRILPWCESIMANVMDDRERTPTSEDVRELKDLVERMASNAEFSEQLQNVVSKVAAGKVDVLANAIFWFLMGWKAADERLRRSVEGVR